MPIEARTIARRTARWTLRLAIGGCALVGAYHLAVPRIVSAQLRSTLANAGYPDAHFELASVGLSHLDLEHVSLRPGLSLGAVSIDAGPWRLWRGGSFGIDLRGPQIDVAAIDMPALSKRSDGQRAKLPVRRVRIEDGSVGVADDRIRIRGSIDLGRRDPAVDVTATSERLQLGSVRGRDLSAQIRIRDGELRACATGTFEHARGKACTKVPMTTLDPRTLDAFDVAWEASDVDAARWSARGTGRLVRTGGSLALQDGNAEISIASYATDELALEDANIRAHVAGDLGDLDLSVRGTMHAASSKTGPVELRGIDLPFALRATSTGSGLVLTGEAPLVAQIANAEMDVRGRDVKVQQPVVRASGQLALAGGKVRLRSSVDERGEALRLSVRVRGLELAPLLDVASAGRVRGTGLLDGGVELQFVDDAWAITRGQLAARGRGVLQATDPAVRSQAVAAAKGVDVQQRVAAALADFRYNRLAFVLDKNPELKLALRGRGARVPQEIDLVMNVHGLDRLANRIGLAQLGGHR